MDFYSIIKPILRPPPPPGKWVPLGKTSEGGSKNADLFTPALHGI